MRSGLLAQLLPPDGPVRQVPPDCIGIVIAPDGTATRHAAGQTLCPPWQKAFLVTTTPQRCRLCLHPACPEIQLDLRYVLDSADPRLAHQRFDLFLASEIGQDYSCDALATQLQTLLQAEMANGDLDCHPQMSLPEWMRFRALLERWLYIRFGLTVEDCALVDAGETLDYAQILLARAAAAAENRASRDSVRALPPAQASAEPFPAPTPDWDAPPAPPARHPQHAGSDQGQLRRLFLELPEFMLGWRALNPPPAFFALQQSVLQRLSRLKVTVAAMPALTLAAPKQPLAPWQIAMRSHAMHDAMRAWEQAWALLARLQPGSEVAWSQPAGLDSIERIFANFEHALVQRAQIPQEPA